MPSPDYEGYGSSDPRRTQPVPNPLPGRIFDGFNRFMELPGIAVGVGIVVAFIVAAIVIQKEVTDEERQDDMPQASHEPSWHCRPGDA
jgi:hypothetical protein